MVSLWADSVLALNFSSNHAPGSTVAHNCPELQTLSLANCEHLTGSSVIEVAIHCPRLASVDLTGCLRVHDEAILELVKSALQLSWLSLSNCELLGKQVPCLSKCCVGERWRGREEGGKREIEKDRKTGLVPGASH